ncbi:MAG: citrate lyase holo-[acyl-carrier protein] synthase [Desulfuromonas sp.]|nr:citrate lyase holo-[acyl-carrier protein] synthase [Desulfuromonas sp.]
MMLSPLSSTATEQSLTPYAALRTDILDAREQRQWELDQFLHAGHNTVLMLSLNYPGPQKLPTGCGALMAWAQEQIETGLGAMAVVQSCDAAGMYSLFVCDRDSVGCKHYGVETESAFAAARLLDIDVYGRWCGQLDRKKLGLPPRRCLLCDQAAVDCIRKGQHDQDAVVRAAQRYLHSFSR